MSTQRRRSAALVGVLLALGAGCGGSNDAVDGVVSVAVPAPTATDAPDFVRNPGEATPAPEGGDTDSADTSTSTSTIAVVPDTGVPGIDSEDTFCRSWSEFAGSFRALGLASALGQPEAAVRLEVIASRAVVDAAERLGVSLPQALEAERTALLDDFAGPFARRASKAQAELSAAGVEAVDDLGAAWLAQLTDTGIDDPDIEVAVPGSVDADALDRAVAAFAAAVPAIVADPSLVTGADIPETEAYLAANCPDHGTLSGNDVISS